MTTLSPTATTCSISGVPAEVLLRLLGDLLSNETDMLLPNATTPSLISVVCNPFAHASFSASVMVSQFSGNPLLTDVLLPNTNAFLTFA